MPKMKTNRAAAKRFRKTASGKFKCGHAFKSHILTKKSTSVSATCAARTMFGPRTQAASHACCRIFEWRIEQWHELRKV